tara:strand:- start:1470 stop:2366 length:897 start_codon:yes stop_codon:yes gene_type:complete
MNFLQKINIKEKSIIAKNFFFEFIWIKTSLYFAIASLFISIISIQFALPQFYVSATLREAEAESGMAINQTGGGGLLGIVGNEGNVFNEFRSNIYSYVVAQRMWEKGWGSQIYAGGNQDIDFNKIERNHTISEKIGSLVVGYDLYDFYSPHDLQAFIGGSVFLSKEIKGTNITVSMMSDNQEFAIEFLNDIILEADRYAKEHLIARSKAVIAETYKQLAVSRNSAITSSLSGTINREYLKIATLENDLPYHIYFIDPPYSSEYPVSPKAPAIFLSYFIIFVFGSILFNFVRKNKDDLW